jgi:hypothetical protein
MMLGASLSIKVNSASESITSGTPKTINLAGGSNTIEITAGLDKDNGNSETVTYTITVFRDPLGVDEFYVSQTGSDTTGDGSAASPFATVGRALELLKTANRTQADTFTIIISGTITGDTGTANGMIDISGDGYPKIVLRGKGSGADAGVIDATGKGKRVLYIFGTSAVPQKVTLGDNLTLTGGSASEGGGVYVYRGTFTMSGGFIQGNSGDGVYLSFSATFFTMSGGVIQGNTASSSSSSRGYGVRVATYGSFTMSGGFIQGNSGGGVYVSGNTSSFTMSGGFIQGNSGRGVYVSGDFTMSGNAVIKGNTASSSSGNSYGGGVYVSGSFTMSGNAVIKENTASSSGGNECRSYGGGVYVSGNTTSSFTMSGGVIRGNTVTSGGGGVYVDSGAFTMSGGAIQGNTASSSGGGVYVDYFATFTKTAGTIYGDTDTTHTGTTENTASSGNGHAVFLSLNGKKRNSDAGTTVNLYAKHSSSYWSYNDTSSGGVGDTTGNWQ